MYLENDPGYNAVKKTHKRQHKHFRHKSLIPDMVLAYSSGILMMK